LVVDDDRQQREIADQVLTQLGYQVETVPSGEDAVQYLAENSIDLLLLDMIMDPGINGKETYKRILTICPGQKAVIVSGFAESDDVKETLELGAGGFIKKPYSIDQLARTINDALRVNA
jgi:DNA-binding NtrC family response regulator